MRSYWTRLALPVSLLAACAGRASFEAAPERAEPAARLAAARRVEVATFGAGCFWCAEAAFEQIEGVLDVCSGFMGGEAGADPDDPHGLVQAGYAEVVQVTFDPEGASYSELLDWFWRIHDPTSLNRQGEDEGPEYRSAVFYHSERQRAVAEASRAAAAEGLARPIVTEVTAAGPFFAAPAEHQDFYRRNRETEYCRSTIAPHLRRAGLEE